MKSAPRVDPLVTAWGVLFGWWYVRTNGGSLLSVLFHAGVNFALGALGLFTLNGSTRLLAKPKDMEYRLFGWVPFLVVPPEAHGELKQRWIIWADQLSFATPQCNGRQSNQDYGESD